ncbi:hypothetical protein J437_LFUL017359 [Ladona fulva]|uniref:BACK domain-containing protein n=1 Tax=Ladona fulva TaxID=123851 RepID=A0A8K0KMI3_LADFU|nr:hypothetical protein J437_LFUL017359 [Ladona fulva]
MIRNDDRYSSTGGRGILPVKRGDESPLLPQWQGPPISVISGSSNAKKVQLASGPVRFRVGKDADVQDFDARREVLANANDVFCALFNGPMPNRTDDIILVPDVDPRAFIEGKEVSFRSPTTALLTLYAANKYIEPRLAIYCLQYLNNKLSCEVVPELLVYVSLFYHEPKQLRGQTNSSRGNGAVPYYGDHSTQTSPVTSPDQLRSDIHLQLREENSSSCLEDSEANLQNEVNGRRRGSKTKHSPSAPSDRDVRKDVDMKDMWRKASYLRHNCFEWVDSNADEILASETAEDFDPGILHNIISRNTLGVSSETVVVDLLQRWSKSECRRRSLPVTDDNRMICLGDLRFMARYLLMDTNEFLHGYKSTKGSQVKDEKISAAECKPPAFSGLLTNEESFWILQKITAAAQSGSLCNKIPPPPSLELWISTMESPRELPMKNFLNLDGKPCSKDGKGKRKDSSLESSSVRSKLRAALTLGWRKSRGEKRRRDGECEKEKPREVGSRKRSKDSGNGQCCSGSKIAEYFCIALSCFFD